MKAFPKDEWDEINEVWRSMGGMDLRDYFAAKAMQTILSSEEFLVMTKLDKAIRCVADGAYKIADEMMEARKQ